MNVIENWMEYREKTTHNTCHDNTLYDSRPHRIEMSPTCMHKCIIYEPGTARISRIADCAATYPRIILSRIHDIIFPQPPSSTLGIRLAVWAYTSRTLSVYRSRFEALPSIGSAIFAEHTVKRSNNATDNGHIYARGFADDCYGLGCDL